MVIFVPFTKVHVIHRHLGGPLLAAIGVWHKDAVLSPLWMLSPDCPCCGAMSTAWCIRGMCNLMPLPFFSCHHRRRFHYWRTSDVCIVSVIQVIMNSFRQILILVGQFFPLVLFLRPLAVCLASSCFKVIKGNIHWCDGPLMNALWRTYSFIPFLLGD